MHDGDVRARLVELQTENEQLRTALRSRIVIEQAKGVLAERFDTTPDEAFQLLRAGARRARRRIHDTAAEIVCSRVTPGWLEVELVRRSRTAARGRVAIVAAVGDGATAREPQRISA
jgi:hypothetical protein